MLVFALSVYACAAVLDKDDIKERVCSWQFRDYFTEMDKCKQTAQMMGQMRLIEQAVCSPITVL